MLVIKLTILKVMIVEFVQVCDYRPKACTAPVQQLDELRGGVEDYFADPARWLACISAAGTVACGPGDPAPIPFDD